MLRASLGRLQTTVERAHLLRPRESGEGYYRNALRSTTRSAGCCLDPAGTRDARRNRGAVQHRSAHPGRSLRPCTDRHADERRAHRRRRLRLPARTRSVLGPPDLDRRSTPSSRCERGIETRCTEGSVHGGRGASPRAVPRRASSSTSTRSIPARSSKSSSTTPTSIASTHSSCRLSVSASASVRRTASTSNGRSSPVTGSHWLRGAP